MDKIVYLLGNGSTLAEMSRQGIESNLSMEAIGDNVMEMSKSIEGEYWKLGQRFGLPPGQDIELIISLLEGCTYLEAIKFSNVCNEARRLFRQYLISQIAAKNVKPKILISLLYLHNTHGSNMGDTGEELSGIITVNYDSLSEEALSYIYGGINYGYAYDSDDYQNNDCAPFLLKLHGSFNWRITNDKLQVSRQFENAGCDDDNSGWIPPSVYKRPIGKVYENTWNKAVELLIGCDILRVVGSSLRNEDFGLVSLLFTSRTQKTPPFDIQLIVSDEASQGTEDSKGIMQRMPFLGEMKNISALPEYEGDRAYTGNPFYDWITMKISQLEKKGIDLSEDEILNKMLWER